LYTKIIHYKNEPGLLELFQTDNFLLIQQVCVCCAVHHRFEMLKSNAKMEKYMGNKWIAVVGSPRIGNNTDILVTHIIEAQNSKNIYVEKYILNSRNITTCSGCEGCMDTGECIITDDMSKIIDAMKTADRLLFASPYYNYNVTAQMKALLDRTFCLNDYQNGWKSRVIPEKKLLLQVSAKE
jgi:ribosomal protein S26